MRAIADLDGADGDLFLQELKIQGHHNGQTATRVDAHHHGGIKFETRPESNTPALRGRAVGRFYQVRAEPAAHP